jgi:hypothetical protein
MEYFELGNLDSMRDWGHAKVSIIIYNTYTLSWVWCCQVVSAPPAARTIQFESLPCTLGGLIAEQQREDRRYIRLTKCNLIKFYLNFFLL